MEDKNIMNIEDFLILDNAGYSTNAIGHIQNKKGYQRVRLSIKLLQSALDILAKQPTSELNKGILLHVKTNYPIQIGKDNLGVIIAPMVNPNDKKYNLEFGNHHFPNLKVGDYVHVKMAFMKRSKKVKLIEYGDNGSLQGCLFFKYGGEKYYLSGDNFVSEVK